MKNEKIIILAICLCSIITVAWATPTLKNCGGSVVDSACSDTACRVDFDPTNAVTNCELDFASPQTNGWTTECRVSDQSEVQFVISQDGSHGNFYPLAPLPSLTGKHIYTICWTYTTQNR